MSGVKRQKVFWDDGGETIKRFHEVDAVLASDYDRLECLVDPGHKLSMDAACGEIAALEAERDTLRAQVEAMRKEAEAMQDLLRKVAPHFAAPPGMGYLHQWIDAALQAKP